MCYNMLIHAHRMKCLKLILESGYYMYMNDLSRKRDWRQEGAVSSLQTRFFSFILLSLGCQRGVCAACPPLIIVYNFLNLVNLVLSTSPSELVLVNV